MDKVAEVAERIPVLEEPARQFDRQVAHAPPVASEAAQLGQTIVETMAKYDNAGKITEEMIIEEGNKAYVKPTLKERVLAGFRNMGEVAGKIKERFAQERFSSLRDMLNDLTAAGKIEAVKAVLDAYFMDGELAWQRISGRRVTWVVRDFKAEKSATTDYAVFALPVGTHDVSQALLRIDNEQKDTGGMDLSSDGGRIAEQFIRQFVQEIGSSSHLVLDAATIQANAHKQFAKFLDVMTEAGRYGTMLSADQACAGPFLEQLKTYLMNLKLTDPAMYKRVTMPNGFTGILQAFLSFTGRTINTYGRPETSHPIASVSAVQVAFEETRSGSGKYAWVVRFDLTPASPSGSATIPIRLIVGYHLTMSTRSQFEATVLKTFTDWRTTAGLPPTW